jgi:hypothetical protein
MYVHKTFCEIFLAYIAMQRIAKRLLLTLCNRVTHPITCQSRLDPPVFYDLLHKKAAQERKGPGLPKAVSLKPNS